MSKSYISKKLRIIVEKRANRCCEYCKSQANFSPSPFNVEHIIPESKDGTTLLKNLAFACAGCNSYKYTKTSVYDAISQKVVSLFHPRTPKWEEHFKWSKDFLKIIALTPIGRVTANTLKINRDEVVNLRKVLFAFGEHPPK